MRSCADESVLVLVPPPGSWTQRGACKGADPGLFFGHSKAPKTQDIRRRMLCAGCPVLAECRAYAMRYPDIRGFWGGMSEQERRDERARLRRTRQVAS